MDSGNLTKYHLINNKTLFSSFNASDESIPIMVANKGIEWSSGGGTCDMLAMRDGCVLGRLLLPNCKYVPPDRFAVNLVSVQRAWADNIRIRFEDHNDITIDGLSIPFDPDDYDLHVVPTPNGAYPAVITRGKRGPTHIGVSSLTDKQQLELKLWSARLNDPTADVLRHLHQGLDGVPAILRKADIHNTFSEARAMANAPRHPAPGRSEPIAKEPGDITSFDHWSAPCTGIFGFTGIIAGGDNSCGHFRLFLVATKTAVPSVARRYYLFAKHDGVKIKPGSILYADC